LVITLSCLLETGATDAGRVIAAVVEPKKLIRISREFLAETPASRVYFNFFLEVVVFTMIRLSANRA